MPVGAGSIGEAKIIFAGSAHGLVEGPHLFKRDGWYYLHDRRRRHRLRSRRHDGARRATSTGPTSCIPNVISSRRRTRRTRPCSAPVTARSSRRRTGTSITRISARGRLPACGARRSAARPRSRNASGATTAGSISRRAGRFPRSRSRRRPAPQRRGPRRRACVYVFSPARPAARFPVAAHAAPRADFFALRAPGLAAADRARIDRLLVRAGAGRAPAGAFRLSRRDGTRLPAADTSSRRPASSPITTATSSMRLPSPGTRRSGARSRLQLPWRLSGRAADVR